MPVPGTGALGELSVSSPGFQPVRIFGSAETG